MSKAVEKYFEHYAESEVTHLKKLPHDVSHCVIIPCYKEKILNLKQYSQVTDFAILFIVVVNEPEDAASESKEINKKLIVSLKEQGELHWKANAISLFQYGKDLLFIVERVGELAIPKKQGVGLARKIAADMASYYYVNQQLQCDYFHSADADMTVPKDYFSELNSKESFSAAIYRFEHEAVSPDLALATQQYDHKLRYYVDGLKSAGSPYAYHSLGSVMVINIDSYIKVRGFPKRNAAEDFYLLNKLAKLGSIIQLTGGKVIIQGRLSNRTPFGTGVAIANLLSSLDPKSEKIYYHPQAFVYLKEFLTFLESGEKSMLCPEVLAYCDDHNVFEILKKFQKDRADSPQQLHAWFDGFKTLKFVHYFHQEMLCMVCFSSLSPC
jgi:hypothetical protein